MKRALMPMVLLSTQAAVACVAPQRAESPRAAATPGSQGAGDLRSPAFFEAMIPDRVERSRALFLEATRVLLHPRCVNCHPAGDSPMQGDSPHPHEPPVLRGFEDRGVVGMECTSCHQGHNLDLARVPGAPSWRLAPRVMAWAGQSAHLICEQIKDPARNGGRTLNRIVDHAAHDGLVAWGWAPGAGRVPAPGTQALFGEIVRAWVDSGAACPIEEARR
jgi:hypothetical protein